MGTATAMPTAMSGTPNLSLTCTLVSRMMIGLVCPHYLRDVTAERESSVTGKCKCLSRRRGHEIRSSKKDQQDEHSSKRLCTTHGAGRIKVDLDERDYEALHNISMNGHVSYPSGTYSLWWYLPHFL
jgi:hypothetical protein